MKILITGGAGFVGSSLADALLQKRNYEIVLVDNLLTGKMENLPQHPNCRFIKCDVNNYNDIAAICLANRCTLVSSNVDKFKRVAGLAVEDWNIPQ